MKGILYIVSTPIGNIEDITLRALRVLKEVDIIAAEDTRHSLKLLSHYGITKPLISYWREREQSRSEEIIRRLHAGQNVALVSDAGTPGISDPGAVVIQRAIAERIPVVVIPGPSAFVAALSLSGLSTERFSFWGFLPSRKSQRRSAIAEIQFEEGTLVFYEAPHRIIETLNDLLDILGDRRAALVKEVTKMHESVLRGTLGEILDAVKTTTVVGEYVLVVEGYRKPRKTISREVLAELDAVMKKGIGRKEAVERIARIYGLSKKELYRASLEGLSREIP